MEVEARPVMAQPSEPRRNLVAWWLLGLLNNSSRFNAAYVIMIAGANEISAAAVGLVYLCAVGPSLLCKARHVECAQTTAVSDRATIAWLCCIACSAPYWFHYVRYTTRVHAVAALMAASYTTVALSSSRGWQLLGVVLASLQGGLGEASCLAMTSYYSGRPAITMWSSGTGFAGVFGYAWIALLHLLGGMSFTATLLAANVTTVAWVAVYHLLLDSPDLKVQQLWRHDSDAATHMAPAPQQHPPAALAGAAAAAAADLRRQSGRREDEEEQGLLLLHAPEAGSTGNQQQLQQQQQQSVWEEVWQEEQQGQHSKPSRAARMTWRERVHRTAVLWPYMVPLALVYFAEYAMQSGAWTAVGFPVSSAAARHRFYVYSNWCYQAGVFLSRSSGMLYQASRRVLWAMPVMQVGWLLFFLFDAVHHFWYNSWLLVPCFVTGLLGGAVYVNAFTLISKEIPSQYREFSLGAASIADSLGVALADACGIIIQGCLFKANGLSGADFKC
ncbi:hypothetical protein ACK3TF_004978 [Chlorella vulgaris]